MLISCIIPAKDSSDPKLKDLIQSIHNQDFPQDKIEIIVVTNGHFKFNSEYNLPEDVLVIHCNADSEQAKAVGIRHAKGEICAMFCADNYIIRKDLFAGIKDTFDRRQDISAIYSRTYYYNEYDNPLNRYFSLIGGNDVVCYYLGKNDRWPQVFSLRRTSKYQPSYGCNGTFYRSKLIKATNLDHYYPMDNALEVPGTFMPMFSDSIWHRTSDNLFTFLRKRYRYARDLYCNRNDRRWRMLDTREDYWRLFCFILATVTIIEPLCVSIRGFRKIRDWAWFWHPIVCIGFLCTYGLMLITWQSKRALSFLHFNGKSCRSV